MSEERIPGTPTDAIESPAGRVDDMPSAAQVVGIDRSPRVLGIDRNPRVYVGEEDSRSADAARYHLRNEEPASISYAEAEQAAAATRAALGIKSPIAAMATQDARYVELASSTHFAAANQQEQSAGLSEGQQPAVGRVVMPPVKQTVARPSESQSARPELGRWTKLVNSLRQTPGQGRDI